MLQPCLCAPVLWATDSLFACVLRTRDMVAEFERVSMAMSEPDAALDALTNKMSRLQVILGEGAWEEDGGLAHVWRGHRMSQPT